MSEKQVIDLKNKTDTLLKLRKAPSQFQILYHLINTGRIMSVKEISTELNLTPKATERAVAKLIEKNQIQRNPFKDSSYCCDTKQIILSLLLTVSDLYEDYEKRNPQVKPTQPVSPELEVEPLSQPN
jgi:predicted transcriptional regulator